MEIKRAIIPFTEIKLDGDDSSLGIFEGYGSVFDKVDLGGDIVRKGAFTESLNEWKSKGQLPQLLWYHNWEGLIGDWLEMSEDDRGLKVRGKLWIHGDLKVPEAIKAYNVMRGTGPKGLSIGYMAEEYEDREIMGGSIVRELNKVKLYEVSVAPLAMNPEASVDSVKRFQNTPTKREVERLLRDAGVSTRCAKALLAGGYDVAFRDVKDDIDTAGRDDQLDTDSILGLLDNLSTTLKGN